MGKDLATGVSTQNDTEKGIRTMTDLPQRRYVLNLKLGADTLEYLREALQQIVEIDIELITDPRLSDGQLKETHLSSTACPDYGWTLTLQLDPDMNHEKYFEAIEAWKAARK